MKKALLLFAALLVAGCGEKSSSEGLESASESAEPSGDTPNSLSDADVERLLKEAVDFDRLEVGTGGGGVGCDSGGVKGMGEWGGGGGWGQ